jgi:predicted  nucleic acid-binding Zn-ribbon protein
MPRVTAVNQWGGPPAVSLGAMDHPDERALVRLLDLQAEDGALDRLRRRLDTLPEAAQLAEVRARLAELSSDADIATKQRDEISREQGRIEAESGVLDQKLQREEQRLFSGSVSNPKELSALQAEVEMLKRQRAGEEDRLLEVMVAHDQANQTLDSLSAERDEIATAAQGLGATVTQLSSEIESELSAHERARSDLEASLPSDLVALYDRLRAGKGGVGAAALERDTCLGCHTRLPAREVERLRAERGLQRCDNCRRILVIR